MTLKTRRLFLVVVAAIAAISLSGCEAVISPKVVGDTTLSMSAEDWNGTWVSEEGDVAFIRVTDSDSGSAALHWVEFEDNVPRLRHAELALRQIGDWHMASLKVPMEDQQTAATGEDEYVFARVRLNKDQLIIWSPDVESFKALVDQGELPGVITDAGVTLGELNEQHLQRMTSLMGDNLFYWFEPATLRRINH